MCYNVGSEEPAERGGGASSFTATFHQGAQGVFSCPSSRTCIRIKTGHVSVKTKSGGVCFFLNSLEFIFYLSNKNDILIQPDQRQKQLFKAQRCCLFCCFDKRLRLIFDNSNMEAENHLCFSAFHHLRSSRAAAASLLACFFSRRMEGFLSLVLCSVCFSLRGRL